MGIYDMSGNVTEYCADDYATYSKDNLTNPMVENEESEGQVVRGGSFADDIGGSCRVSARSANRGYKFGSLGFRIVLEAK
jgi:formylglycine-generating enzyme required for sulfatase activity